MITLYEHPLSPYAQKVKIALREKGLEFEAVAPGGLGAGGVGGDFAKASPRGGDDLLGPQIGLGRGRGADGDRLIGHLHRQAVGVGLGIDEDGGDV